MQNKDLIIKPTDSKEDSSSIELINKGLYNPKTNQKRLPLVFKSTNGQKELPIFGY